MDTGTKRPLPDDETAAEERQGAGMNGRKLKKRKKTARKLSQNRLTSAQETHFTGSVVVDKPCALEDAGPCITQLQVTTTCLLPKQAQVDKIRMLNVHKPLHVYIQPLLVLDLNGILCHRIRSHKSTAGCSYRPAIDYIAATQVIPRPDLACFLSYMDAHFCLAVWSSAKQKTVRKLIQALIPPQVSKKFLFVWGQNRCKATKHDDTEEEEEVYIKELDKVWQEFPLYNEQNTLLLDDSPEKCPIGRNALHPAPLHGQSRAPTSQQQQHWISDFDNHALQLDFFRKLVDFWETNRITASWDEMGDVRYNSQSDALWKFLEENATEHMGWRKG